MLYLVTGGSGSGKSEFAERLAVLQYEKTGASGRLYYIATMNPGRDEETLRKIARHRDMRGEKNFSTIECYHHLDQVKVSGGDVLLIECMSNLLANEMYMWEGQLKVSDQVMEAIVNSLYRLAESAACVVVVTNEVFSDGVEYDEEMQRYLSLLGTINRELAKLADGVVEVVYSIPLWKKGGIE